MRNVYAHFGKAYWPTEEQLTLLDKLGFYDTAWHNNGCPSFELGDEEDNATQVILWTDAEKPEDREYPEESRFAVWTNDYDNNRECVYAGDDFETAVLYSLIYWAKPQPTKSEPDENGDTTWTGEDDWGSDRQVKAENNVYIQAEAMLSTEDFEAVEEYCLKATTEEGFDFVLQRIADPRFPKDRPFDTTDQVLAEHLEKAATAAHQLSTFLRASVQSPIAKQRGQHYREIAKRLDLMREEHDNLWERG